MNHEKTNDQNQQPVHKREITVKGEPGNRFRGISPYDIELDRIERMEFALQNTLDLNQARLIAAAINHRRERIRRIDSAIHDLRLTHQQRRERMEGISTIILPDNPFDEHDSCSTE